MLVSKGSNAQHNKKYGRASNYRLKQGIALSPSSSMRSAKARRFRSLVSAVSHPIFRQTCKRTRITSDTKTSCTGHWTTHDDYYTSMHFPFLGRTFPLLIFEHFDGIRLTVRSLALYMDPSRFLKTFRLRRRPPCCPLLACQAPVRRCPQEAKSD